MFSDLSRIIYISFLWLLGTNISCLSQNEILSQEDILNNNFIEIHSVVTNYKPDTILDYDMARKKLYTEIYNENDTVTCMYTGYKLYLSKNEENPVGHLMKFNPLKSIITEHSYPKSKGAMTGNAKSDMHHLFPVRLGVNVARYNHPFANIMSEDCKTWFSKNESFKQIPVQSIETYAKKRNKAFAPKDDFKGNVARAVFYFFTMYTAEALESDPAFFELQKEVLLQWHLEDPVDDQELRRSKLIATYQSSKPNPFVIDPSLAMRMYGSKSE